ncbi:MAG: hypothetical protein NT016_02770 [Candidatus Aenigmarchaeota archaeon]|nr:hypothetical protein [Candidatus Aenigmarchaeota archaeon]
MPRRKKSEAMEEKFEKSEEPADRESAEETSTGMDTEQQKDIKLGEFQLRPDSVLLVKKTTYKGDERIDFRVWKNTAMYKGPTKQGFVLPMDMLDDFIKMVSLMKKKLAG